MDSNKLIFVKLEHKRLLYNLIADVLLIVGAILIFRQPAMSLVVQLLGSLMIIFQQFLQFFLLRSEAVNNIALCHY